MLTQSQRRAVHRQCGVGIPAMEIAQTFDISVRDVQRIDLSERQKSHDRRKLAEPLPGLKDPDWKTARPAEDRIRRGEACRFPECVSTVFKGSYCAEHGRLIYRPRVAA